jgi:hypothetical protein
MVEHVLDELLAALVRKLPETGKPFPGEARDAWLKMAAMAFEVAYGPTDQVLTFPPRSSGPHSEQPAIGKPADVALEPAKPAPAKPPLPRFLIDTDGTARLNSGERILPSEIIGPIYDLRGELGDLGSILWADGSRGVLGLHLDISTAV